MRTSGLPSLLIALLLLTTGLAGCIGSEDAPAPTATDEPAEPAWTPCEHPYPCGDGSEWPQGVEGPFEVAAPEVVDLESFDGTALRGVVWRPVLPEGVGAPVVLVMGPYYCQTVPCADDPGWGSERDIYPDLLAAGYAVAHFSARGTGHSGGCFDLTGPAERQDALTIVDWLATREWSNERVGMYGISHMGATPWLPAVEKAAALKTIVPLGIVTDWYTEAHSPQGAIETTHGAAHLAQFGGFSWGFTPGRNLNGDESWLGHVPEKICEDAASALLEIDRGGLTGQRDGDFWDERRTLDELPEVEAATFVVHGLRDFGHAHQDDAVWNALTKAPKRMLLGQWGHQNPPTDDLEGAPLRATWSEVALAWFDFWLKGIGEPDRLGLVDFQDDTDVWHASEAWPPAEAADEVLYLAGDTLAPQPIAQDHALFLPGSALANSFCSSFGGTCTQATSATLVSTGEAANETVRLAGNPSAYLQLSSDVGQGIVTVSLFDVAPDASCDHLGCTGLTTLSWGVADLRFHAGNYIAEPFPTDEPTHVRIDLDNLAHVVDPGHRLAVVVGHGSLDDSNAGAGQGAQLTVHGGNGAEASHIILPVIEGTLGGKSPTVDYPPRPFLPEGVGG